MDLGTDMRALYISVNVGFTDRIMDIIWSAGGKGGTIVHTRGIGSQQQSFMGISLDYERELIISIVDKETAARIISDIQQKAGWKTEVRGICYTMPIERFVGLRTDESLEQNVAPEQSEQPDQNEPSGQGESLEQDEASSQIAE